MPTNPIDALKDLNSKLPDPAGATQPQGARPLFNLPGTDQPPAVPYNGLPPELERRRQNIELIKWFIGSVVLVLITTIINWNLRDREDSFKEVQEYNKYATDLIILNNDPVKKRMLAQFFAQVIPSSRVRNGWQAYYELVNPEYEAFLAKNAAAQKAYDSLAKKPAPSVAEQVKKDSLSTVIKSNIALIQSEFVTPATLTPPPAPRRNPALAAQWESKGFKQLLDRDVENAIVSFENAESAYPSYHQVYEIANLLRQRQTMLRDKASPEWPSVHNQIATKFSWRIPTDVQRQLLNSTAYK